MDILWLLLIGLISGWIAGNIMHGGGYGVIGDSIVGIIGAVVGGLIFGFFGISAYGTLGNIIMAVIGAVVLIAILRMLSPKGHVRLP